MHANTLPIWPPKPNSFPEVKQQMPLPKTGHNADDFINELLALNQKRRGIEEKSPPRPSHLDLSGSHNLTSPKYRQMTQQAPFYENVIEKGENKIKNTSSGLGPRNPMSESMSKFVAGSFRPEKSDLMGPGTDLLSTHQPNLQSSLEPYVCDLSTADAQYERYKNVMRSNFYNLQANSTMRSG